MFKEVLGRKQLANQSSELYVVFYTDWVGGGGFMSWNKQSAKYRLAWRS